VSSRPTPGRNEFGNRHAVAGNEDLFPFERLMEEMGFGLVDIEGGHGTILVRNMD
jgi:hypothetical protein